MNPRSLAANLTLLAVIAALFLSGYSLGRTTSAGRPIVQTLDREALQDVLSHVDTVSRPFVTATTAARPGVVHIITTRLVAIQDPFEEFWEMLERSPRRRRRGVGRQQSTGSGAIVDPRGYILTNFHVVGTALGDGKYQAAQEIQVVLHDGRRLPARAVGLEPESDLALIKVEGTDLAGIPLGDSDKVEVGQWVIAIGSPFGLDQTVTAGIVSAKSRKDVGVAAKEDFIQTDAAINPGNSGGPLVDLQGRLVGINTAIVSRSGGSQGIGFAIPINFARQLLLSRVEK